MPVRSGPLLRWLALALLSSWLTLGTVGPLEYAHLFPEVDINASRNLTMVHVEVHQHINRAWTHFRQLRPAPTAEEVQRALAIIDAQFASWYQKVGRPSGAEAVLGDAEKAVLNALDELFPR